MDSTNKLVSKADRGMAVSSSIDHRLLLQHLCQLCHSSRFRQKAPELSHGVQDTSDSQTVSVATIVSVAHHSGCSLW